MRRQVLLHSRSRVVPGASSPPSAFRLVSCFIHLILFSVHFMFLNAPFQILLSAKTISVDMGKHACGPLPILIDRL